MTHPTRRTVLQSIGGLGIALGTGTAAAAGRGRRDGASADETLFEIVEASDDFDTLELALEETGLDGVLDADDDQYTVFAPTDAAFDALLDELGITADELLARDDLETILLYHVTEGRRYSPSITNPGDVEMLTGGTVTTDGTVLNDGQAEITDADIEASNGVAHVIDGVLLP